MKKTVTGFILGAICTSLFWGFSTTASVREPAERQAVPADNPNFIGILDCNEFSWMQNCTEVNKNASEHPDVPLRVKTKSGHELNIAPGTPTALMNMMLKGTPESAAEFADYLERDEKLRQRAASLWKAEMAKRGGINGSLKELQTKLTGPPKDIDYDRIKTFVFYDSECAYCKKMLPELKALKDRHPKLKLSLLQIDLNKPALIAINKKYGLNAKLLSGPGRAKFLPLISKTPTVWIQDNKNKADLPTFNFMRAAELESVLAKVSNNEKL